MKLRDVLMTRQFNSGESSPSSNVPSSVAVSPQPPAPSWPCSSCGQQAEIEAVESSLDGQRTLTLWKCEPCQTYGVTPDTIRQPPVWVKKQAQ